MTNRIPERYRFNKEIAGKLAIFCSDERFIKVNLDFMKDSLSIGSCDLMVVPGGPAFIANDENEFMKRLGVLMEVHEIDEVILIAHSDCGYYNKYFSDISEEKKIERQIDDLKEAVIRLNKSYPGKSIQGFYGRIHEPDSIEYIHI
jgi:carbonic anhydrase